jgi:hypothetical protein
MLPFVAFLRAALLIGAGSWSLWLAWSIARTKTAAPPRQILAAGAMTGAILIGCLVWANLFWRFV